MILGWENIRRTALRTSGALVAGLILGGCGMQSIPGTAPPKQHLPTYREGQPPVVNSVGSPVSAPESEITAAGTNARNMQSTPAVQRCHTSMLSGSVVSSGGGAGQRYAELILRNGSEQTCTLYGYGELQLVGAGGESLPTNLERTLDPGPSLLRLAPSETASATLRWSVVPHGDEPIDQPCQPRPETVRVIPPDETESLTIPWGKGFVCGGGSIDGSAYHR